MTTQHTFLRRVVWLTATVRAGKRGLVWVRKASAPELWREFEHTKQWLADRFYENVTRFFGLLVCFLFVGLLSALIWGALPALKHFGWRFFTRAEWDPVKLNFGALIPIYGTLVTSSVACLVAIPASFGIALFFTELCPTWLKQPLGIAVELLAAIPSIIYGMWGLFVLGPFMATYVYPWLQNHLGGIPAVGALFQGPPTGVGTLTGGLILGIMIIPFMSSILKDALEMVPRLLKESAYGLGATTWEVVWCISLRYARIGVFGGILLGLGRALGETMAVTFVMGNAHSLSASLLMPGNTIASVLANEFTEAVGEIYTSSLIALGLVLFLITFAVLSLAKLLLYRLSLREERTH